MPRRVRNGSRIWRDSFDSFRTTMRRTISRDGGTSSKADAAEPYAHETQAVEQADAADEPHGGWKDSKVAYLHLKSASQLIRGVRRTLETLFVSDAGTAAFGRHHEPCA